MGKQKKEHRKKIAKRNELINQEKKRFKKIQQDLLMQLIEKEKKAGKFNNQTVPSSGPALDLGDGPQI